MSNSNDDSEKNVFWEGILVGLIVGFILMCLWVIIRYSNTISTSKNNTNVTFKDNACVNNKVVLLVKNSDTRETVWKHTNISCKPD